MTKAEKQGSTVYQRGLDTYTLQAEASTIERSVFKLRSAIMNGELRPGQKLVEADLCTQLEASRPSVREALRALEAEKLIELVANRGPSVARLDYRDVEAIHEVWALLTSTVVYDFTKIAKEEDLVELDRALAALRTAINHAAPLEQLSATNAFFNTIMHKCGNWVLQEVVVSLISRVNFLRAHALLHRDWGGLYAQEISDILDAIRAHEPDRAREATRKHIASACAAAKLVTTMGDLSEAGPAAKTSVASPQAKRRRAAPAQAGAGGRRAAG